MKKLNKKELRKRVERSKKAVERLNDFSRLEARQAANKEKHNEYMSQLMHCKCNDCKIQLIVKLYQADHCNLCDSSNITVKEWTRCGNGK